MAGPWEKYQQQTEQKTDGPWARYGKKQAAAPEAKPDFSGVRGAVRGTAGLVPRSLEQINAENRAKHDPAEFERIGLANKKHAYDQLPGIARFAAGVGEPVDRLIRGTAGLFQPDAVSQPQEAQARAIAEATVKSDVAGQAGRFGGEVALLAAPMAGLKSGYATAMGAGGLYGALQPTVEGENRLENAAVGAALGGVGQKVGNVIGESGAKAASAISKEVRELYAAARARGIELTPAQLSDSKAIKFLQSALQRLPVIGGSAKVDAQTAAWNRELARSIGEDAPVVTPDVYAAAKARQSAQFDQLTGRNNLQVTPELLRKLEAIRSEASIDDDAAAAVNNALTRFYQHITDAPGGADGGLASSAALGDLPGRAYQALDSVLGNVTKQGNTASHYVRQVQSALREAMDGSISPQDAAAWRTLRTEYGNRKTIRDLVAKSDGGPISPAALMGRANANNAGKEAMASGRRGDLGELARIGQRIKEPQSSGTAERLGSMAVGAGAIANLPLTLAALVGGSALKKGLDSSALARLLLREGRGQTRQALAPHVRNSGVAATPVVADKRRKDARKRK